MKKGFTLIELLAVIVILAIIAIIATPIILNIISDSKESANKISAENYLVGVKQAVLKYQMGKINETVNGTWNITNEGDLCSTSLTNNRCPSTSTEIKVSVDGEKATEGTITFTNGKITDVQNIKVSETTYSYNSSKVLVEGTTTTEDTTPEPVSFATDSWATIIKAFKEGSYGKYHVGDEKEVTLTGFGTYTVRIANLSTPSECNTTGFSQSACGVVIEFVDIITEHVMNSTDTNTGGWPASEMYAYLNPVEGNTSSGVIYNAIADEDLKAGIINTTVVSGHGSSDTNPNRTDENWESTDKLYLLSPTEVYGSSFTSVDIDTSRTLTRKLDYYSDNNVTTPDPIEIKEYKEWWLRSAVSYQTYTYFFYITIYGDWDVIFANASNGVAPAFRLATN